MDFLFYEIRQNSLNKPLVEGYDHFLELSEYSSFLYNDGTKVFQKDGKLLALTGRVMKLKNTEDASLSYFYDDLNLDIWPISDSFTGAFSGFLFGCDEIRVFNDPLGLYKLFFYISDGIIAISTRLSDLTKIKHFDFDFSSWFLEFTRPEYSQYGTRTIFKSVKTLLPGEYKLFRKGENVLNLFDTTIKQEDKSADRKKLAVDFVELINEEFDDFYKEYENLTIPMSGGIDSRVILAPFIGRQKQIVLSNYGTIDGIDSSIPLEIAKKFKFHFEIFNTASNTFPTRKFLWDLVNKTDSIHVNAWFSHLQEANQTRAVKQQFLLGDMCDILRSKGAETIKSRAFRKKYYIQNFFKRTKIKLTKITPENILLFQVRKKERVIGFLKNIIEETKYLPLPEQQIIDEAIADMDELFTHMDRYRPRYIESYEELFGIFTHGRKSMGKQLNLLKYGYQPEIPLLNIRIVRKVLNYSPAERYSDELTNEMFKVKSWKPLGKFKTSQNPFFRYNSPYFMMLLGWFVRSSVDQLLTKMTIKGLINRPRLFKNLNSKDGYQYPGAYENFEACLENDIIDVIKQKETFIGRRDGSLWPLSSMDLMPILQAIYYLNRFGKDKK